MSINLTAETINGVHKAALVDFYEINESGSNAVFNADITGCKDPIALMIDVPSSASGNQTVNLIRADGSKKTACALEAGKLNVIYITSKDFKKSDGSMDIEITTDSGSGLASQGNRIALLKYTPVINH